MTKLTASQLMVIVDTLYRSLRVANFGTYDEKTRQETMEDVVKILHGIRLDVVAENSTFDVKKPVEEYQWNETGDGV